MCQYKLINTTRSIYVYGVCTHIRAVWSPEPGCNLGYALIPLWFLHLTFHINEGRAYKITKVRTQWLHLPLYILPIFMLETWTCFISALCENIPTLDSTSLVSSSWLYLPPRLCTPQIFLAAVQKTILAATPGCTCWTNSHSLSTSSDSKKIRETEQRAPRPTLHPNMSEMVLFVQATLQWHSMGEKQSNFLMLGDIFSPLWQLSCSASEEPETRLRERFLLLPLQPPPAPPPLPAHPPPPAPPLLLLLPALTIHPHSSSHSIMPGKGQPVCFLHPASFPHAPLSVTTALVFTCLSVPFLFCFTCLKEESIFLPLFHAPSFSFLTSDLSAVSHSGNVYTEATQEPCCVKESASFRLF